MPLVDDLQSVINLSHAEAWDNASKVIPPTTPDEPGLVSAFLSANTQDQLRGVLAKHFFATPLNVVLSSVFTHKTPQVYPWIGMPPAKSVTAVEIGDLLLIRQHFAYGMPGGATSGKALLFQAKKNILANSGNVSTGNPNIQFDLYQKWPVFEGKPNRLTKGPPGKSVWDFKTSIGTIPPCSEYLAVYGDNAFVLNAGPPPVATPRPGSTFPASNYSPSGLNKTSWASAPIQPMDIASAGVACNRDFAETLEKFISGSLGHTFTPGKNSDDWSTFINEMIGMAALGDYTFTSARTGVKSGASRKAEVHAFSTIAPYLQLAMQRRYSPKIDIPFKLPDNLFISEYLPFISDLSKFIERQIPPEITPPARPPVDFGENEGPGHVPMLMIVTTGPEPLENLFPSQ